MNQRYHNSQKEVKGMNTAELREQFLIEDLMKSGEIDFTYSHYDRIIVGGERPGTTKVRQIFSKAFPQVYQASC